ncbi:MAG: 3'-5' exonuclease [Parachlamydiaceae bacterium]
MLTIFLDIETTGLDYRIHHPIDIALKVVDAATGEEKLSYQSLIKVTDECWSCRDLNSMEVNGYTWGELQEGKALEIVSSEIINHFRNLRIERGKAVFICQNPGFDKCFFTKLVDVYTQEKLNWPYHWLDFASMYWAYFLKEMHEKQQLFPEEISLSKNMIAANYQLPEEQLPHKAANGVDHLLLCYKTIVGFPKSHLNFLKSRAG